MDECYDTENLKNLTIIILTFQRQPYALRNMEFWSGKPAQVIVVDGCESAIDEHMLANLHSNVRYVCKYVSVHERIKLALELVETEYVMFCADDEFMVPSGLIQCVNFLEAYPDYSAVCGRIIGFKQIDGECVIFPEKSRHKDHVVNQDSVVDRVSYHISNYEVTTIYGVHRVSSFKSCILQAIDVASYNGYLPETFFELLSAAFGKSAILPVPTWFRSFENEPISTKDLDRNIYISDWYFDPINRSEVKEVVDIAANAVFSIDDGVDYGLIRGVVQKSLALRARKEIVDCSDKNGTVSGFVKKYFPYFFYSFIRYIYRSARFIRLEDHYVMPCNVNRKRVMRFLKGHDMQIDEHIEEDLYEIFETINGFMNERGRGNKGNGL